MAFQSMIWLNREAKLSAGNAPPNQLEEEVKAIMLGRRVCEGVHLCPDFFPDVFSLLLKMLPFSEQPSPKHKYNWYKIIPLFVLRLGNHKAFPGPSIHTAAHSPVEEDGSQTHPRPRRLSGITFPKRGSLDSQLGLLAPRPMLFSLSGQGF